MRSIPINKFDGSMHPKASNWDTKHGKSFDYKYWAMSDLDIIVPVNRPCSWCGKTVGLGYMHMECVDEETNMLYKDGDDTTEG